MSDERDVRDELRDIAASLRAYLEQQAESGATGIPRGERSLRAQRPAPEPREARAPEPTPAHAPVRAAPPPHEAPRVVAPSPPTVQSAAFLDEVPPAPRPEPPPAAKAPAPGPTDAPPRPVRSLPVLAAEVASCRACRLAETRNKTVFSRGNPEAAIVFVGEGPGADEDAQGLPFVGRAGQLLDKMIVAMGLDPERDVYVCNIVKCRPPGNRRPEADEMAACFPYLDEQLANVKPKVMVAMGGTAATALFDTKLGITRLRGQWKLYKGIPTMPTFHPSYLLRPSDQQAEAKRQCWDDLQAVMKHLGLTRKPRA